MGGQGRAGQPRQERVGEPGQQGPCLHQQGLPQTHKEGENSEGRKLYCILFSLYTLSSGSLTCRGEDGKGTLSKLRHRSPAKETDFKSREKDL